jgi:uncharacterized protein (DUF1697 family)
MVGREGLTTDVLVGIFAKAGAEDPKSHLATGNVTFSGLDGASDVVERAERAIAEVIGRTEPVFVRSVDQLHEQIDSDPFRDPPFPDVHERCVSFTSGTVVELALPVGTPRGDATAFAIRDSDIYSVTRLVGGRPGTMGRVLERALGRPVTTRNWNTIELIVRRLEPGGRGTATTR